MGYWLTGILCRCLASTDVRVEVYDKDTFEGGSGYLRLPKAWDRSQFKVELLAAQVAFVMGDRPPKVHKQFLTPDDVRARDWRGTIFVDCTDMGEGREELWNAIEQAGAVGIRGSYDGRGQRTISPGPPLSVGTPVAGYDVPPNFAQCISAAGDLAQAVLYLLYTGKVLEFQHFIPTFETSTVNIIERSQPDVILHTDSAQVSDSQELSGAD